MSLPQQDIGSSLAKIFEFRHPCCLPFSSLPLLNDNIQMQTINNQLSDINHIMTNRSVGTLEAQIKQMVELFVDNFGMTRKADATKVRNQYAMIDEKLAQVFDILKIMYSTVEKSKGELTKWIMKKVFISKQEKNSYKDIFSNLGHRLSSIEEKREDLGNSVDEDRISNLKVQTIFNKPTYIHLLDKLFESEEFKQDFDTFMDHFEYIIQKETSEKIMKFADFIVECMKKDKIEYISTFKKIPWPKIWSQKANRLAVKLEDKYMGKYYLKKIRGEK